MFRKKRFFVVLLSAIVCGLALGSLLFTTADTSYAEEAEVYVAEEEERDVVVVVDLVPLPTATPKPYVEEREFSFNTYYWDNETIDAVASIYWTTCNTDKGKLAVTQLIWNRMQYGEPFADTIVKVCKQKGEFVRGRVSDRNREKARKFLNYVRSQSEGCFSGIYVPSSAVRMKRDLSTGELVFMNIKYVEVYRVKD